MKQNKFTEENQYVIATEATLKINKSQISTLYPIDNWERENISGY